MAYDYFYNDEPEQYQFYKLPKLLVQDDSLKNVSMDAKVIYSLMLDRAGLSKANGWLDEYGRVFIYFTNDEVCKILGCANQKATKLLNELEHGGLIIRKRSGFNKPARIYVMNFATALWESHDRTHENHDSSDVKIMTPDSWKSHPNNTENNNTEDNQTDSSNIGGGGENHISVHSNDIAKRGQYRIYFYDQLDIPVLKERYPYENDRINEILELLVDVCAGDAEKIRINEEDKPGSVVRSAFMKLNYNHIGYVLHYLDESKTEIRNMRGYLLTLLYNAPMSMNSYYQAKANHDMQNRPVWEEGDYYR